MAPPPERLALIAAFLGLQESSLRTVVSRHHIPCAGMRGRAKLYAVADILAVTGPGDRLAARPRP